MNVDMNNNFYDVKEKTSILKESPCASQLKVLADPTRLAILKTLMDKPQHVGEVATLLNIEQSLLSHHLHVLRKTGFVVASREGKAVLYSLAPGIVTNGSKAINLGCCLLSF